MSKKKKPVDKNRRWHDFRSYQLSPEWRKLRDQALEHYGGCVHCGSQEKLVVLHRNYRNLFREGMRDLIVLCPGCQIRFEQQRSGDWASDMADQYMRVMGIQVSEEKSTLHHKHKRK